MNFESWSFLVPPIQADSEFQSMIEGLVGKGGGRREFDAPITGSPFQCAPQLLSAEAKS